MPTNENSKQLVIAFTSTAGLSNSPLQQIVWSRGTPCAFTEQADFYGTVQPWFHVAEKDKYVDACEKQDGRYQSNSLIDPPPNEFQIQSSSGVWDTIMSLPQEDGAYEEAQPAKSATPYTLQTRATVKFSESCGKSISDAIVAQENLSDSAEIENGWLGLAIFTAFLVAFNLIFNLVYCCKFQKDGCAHDMAPDSLVYTLIRTFGSFLTTAVVSLSTVTNFAQIHAKYTDQETWAEFSDCLDEYTAIPADQVATVQQIYIYSLVALICGLVIVVPHTIFMVS